LVDKKPQLVDFFFKNNEKYDALLQIKTIKNEKFNI